MTDHDLGALLQLATADLPEVDFAEAAWRDARQERARRRRTLTGGAGALLAAAVAVVAVQVSDGGDHPRPPQYTVTAPPTSGTLADGTRYDVLPLEGDEDELPLFKAGLPPVVDAHAGGTALSSLTAPMPNAVAVFLRREGEGYRPVLVTSAGQQVVADHLLLSPTRDASGNTGVPLGPRAIGAGRYVLFPQPGAVVRLDVQHGDVRRYAVPSPYVDSVGWFPSTGQAYIRAGDRVWTVDALAPGSAPTAGGPSDGEGTVRLGVSTDTRSLGVSSYDPQSLRLVAQRSVPAPVTELRGSTVSSTRWSASEAFFDQNLTHPVIQRGNGPIYQGLVAVPVERGRARLLLAPESPDGQTGRFKGCCSVLGWADGHTVLFQTVGSHGSWVLAWDVDSGQVYQVSRVRADPAREQVPVLALNVGWRD